MTQPEGFVQPKNSGKSMQASKIHLWFEAGLSELESSF